MDEIVRIQEMGSPGHIEAGKREGREFSVTDDRPTGCSQHFLKMVDRGGAVMKQIIAMGGGGFLMEPENLLLDEYILDQSLSSKPKVCFVPTASGDSAELITRFYESFGKLTCDPSHLSLFKPPVRDLASFVLEKDIIYVGGGNTKNLLALWREWGLDKVMRQAWERGVILAGISAGSLCWFEDGVTDSYADGLEPIRALGFIAGSNCPHYDGEEQRRPRYRELIGAGVIQGGLAADDGAAVHLIGDQIHRAISSRPDAGVYRVELETGNVKEHALPMNYLGE